MRKNQSLTLAALNQRFRAATVRKRMPYNRLIRLAASARAKAVTLLAQLLSIPNSAVTVRERMPYNRFIRLAAYPAPKPLSMFTTVTLLAQLLSMPNSAAKPWKLAP